MNVHNQVNKKVTKLNSQPVFTCLKLTTETLKQDVKYVQS